MSGRNGNKKCSELPVIHIRKFFLLPRGSFVCQPVIYVCGTQDRIDLHAAPPHRHGWFGIASPGVRGGQKGGEGRRGCVDKMRRIVIEVS